MRLGIAIEETWDFFHEVYADLRAHHDTTLFERHALRLPLLGRRLAPYWSRREMQAFLKRQDAVFFEWASELLATASTLPKTSGIVARLHRYELYQWADRINWDAVDRLIVVSQAKVREFAEAFPAQTHKVVMIPEAVSVQRFRPVEKLFGGDIGILCHMRPRKRVYELVLAFHELVQQRPGFHLHIGGGRAGGFGEYDDAVRQLVQRLGLADKVTFYGHVTKPEEWYPRLDVFISNGYSEGLQVSLLEAMAAGVYCLSHNWEGADELVPAENLYFTNTELVQQLLRHADKSEVERARDRERMRAIVCDGFDVDVTKVAIRRVIEEANARAGA
ncbi:MAG: glycosyltransferase family 4 protein [Vicinamibacterales bacterium]